MLKAVGMFTRKKPTRPFKDYYAEWFNALKNNLLPTLRRSIHSSSPTLLASHVELLHHHFQSYYHALDIAASYDVAQILYPDWRNYLEKPFLFLADLHPYLFTNLLRSFLNDDIDLEEPWQIAMAWKNPSKVLMARIEQIECGLRLMVPYLVARSRTAQAGFLERVVEEWVKCEGKKEMVKLSAGEAMAAQMEEMVSVVLDANRVRRSVLAEIIAATSVYQAALFLERLAQFLVGFRDGEFMAEFERCMLTPAERQLRMGI